MHTHTHEINLDNLPAEYPVKKLIYVSLLDVTIPELELMEMLINNKPVPQGFLVVAKQLQERFAAMVADVTSKLTQAQPKSVTE